MTGGVTGEDSLARMIAVLALTTMGALPAEVEDGQHHSAQSR